MSAFYKEWELLSIKVKALRDASNYLFNSLQINSFGADAPMRDIYLNCKDNFRLVSKFQKDFDLLLPKEVLNCLDDIFLSLST